MSILKPVVCLAMAIADKLIGTREEPLGSNRGTLVTKFLNSIGLDGGYAWCAAFVYYCIMVACGKLGVAVTFKRTGACVLFERWARTNKILFADPQAGDVFLSYSTPHGESRRRASHTGFVISVDGKAETFDTIEGNTNLGGSREGIGVFRRTRPFESRYKFIRWNGVAVNTAAAAVAATPSVPPVKPVVANPFKVFLSGKFLCVAPSIDGRVWLPVRSWYRSLGLPLHWNQEHQVCMVQGREVPLDLRVSQDAGGQNTNMAPIRQLVKFSGLKLRVDNAKREIYITR